MADFASVIYSVPPVTRTLLAATALVTLPCLLGIISPAKVALMWYRVANFEVWRPFTAFFFGGSGFPLLYDFFLIYRNSSALERDVYFGNTPNYAWVHLMLGLFIHILNTPFGFPFLFRPLLHAQTYLWCRANPTMKVSIFGLLTIPTSLYPPALVVLDLLTGGPGKALTGCLGLLAGHIWWFISVYLPLHAPPHLRRPNPLSTPPRFRALFSVPSRAASSSTRGGGTGLSANTRQSGATPTSLRDPAEAVRHRWGGGQRLGGEAL